MNQFRENGNIYDKHTHMMLDILNDRKGRSNQIDYIKQAINIFEEIKSGRKNEWKGFKWTCETFGLLKFY